MRKIDKSTNFSTKYKEWLDKIEEADKDHPKYSSSNFRFYNDIKFDLLRCQKGLCAYTEMRLCASEILTKDNWEGGKYKFEKGVTKSAGQLEHFDSNLKEKKAWIWDNLFVADSDANRDKSTIKVDEILKPNKADYDPHKLLEFDFEKMVYIPNSERKPKEQNRIKAMIEILGINHPGHVKTRREGFVNKLKKEIEFEIFDKDEYEEDEFPTVVEMLLRKLELS